MVKPLLRHLSHEQRRLGNGLLAHPQTTLCHAYVHPLPQDHLLLPQLRRREEVDREHLLVRGHEGQVGGLVRVDDGGPCGGVEDHATARKAAVVVGGLGWDEGAEMAAGVAEDDRGAGTEGGLPVQGQVHAWLEENRERVIIIIRQTYPCSKVNQVDKGGRDFFRLSCNLLAAKTWCISEEKFLVAIPLS